MLHRMHAETAPRSWVVGFVVQGMHMPVKEGSNVALLETILSVPPWMHPAVSAIEMNFTPICNGHQS